VTPDGEVSSPARLIDTPIIWAAWALNWLPDGSAVTLTGQSPPSGRFDVWLVPVQNGGRPVALTRDDPSDIGYNVLSPDGRYVAYRTWVERGSSLWLADLGDALTRER
jgi:Tol biopolymer transport system component